MLGGPKIAPTLFWTVFSIVFSKLHMVQVGMITLTVVTLETKLKAYGMIEGMVMAMTAPLEMEATMAGVQLRQSMSKMGNGINGD